MVEFKYSSRWIHKNECAYGISFTHCENFNDQELVVSGLEQIHLFFPSQIMLDTSLSDNVIGIVDLFTSSNKSGIMSDRFMLSPDPKSNPFIKNLNQRGKVLGAASKFPVEVK